MKNCLSKFIISSLVLTITLATVTCCTVFGATEASVVKVEKQAHKCCPVKGDTSNAPEKSNQCCKPQLQADFSQQNLFNISLPYTSLVSSTFLPPQQLLDRKNVV